MYKVYVVLDRVAGVYSEPWLALNDEVAARTFREQYGSNSHFGDLDLYATGTYDSNTGLVSGFNTIVFLSRGTDHE